MAEVVLIAGGNLGDVAQTLCRAADMVSAQIGNIISSSLLYHSDAWGFESQDRFTNQVWIVDSNLEPMEILVKAQHIEMALGREPKPVNSDGYASRTMDIDILFYDDMIVDTAILTIPHPLLHRREFVLEPLSEVSPDWIHPLIGKTVSELLNELRR